MKRKLLTLAACLAFALSATAQTDDAKKITVTGSIQSDILIPQEDEAIGTGKYDDWGLTNTYAEARLRSKYVEAGARVEFMKFPLPGFENDFKGWGVPHFYVKGGVEKAELTLGTFYEQFGSGFILRTYEERSLGIDNSLLGGRLLLKPVQGVQMKVLGGHQRRYWDHNKSWISGADLELTVSDWIPSMQQSGTTLTLGGSWVNKHEEPGTFQRTEAVRDTTAHTTTITTWQMNQPRYVNAWDARANLNTGNFSLLLEYAQKTDDPTFANGYIFKKGEVAMLSTSYSRKGLSLLLQAKRSENMAFKSDRTVIGTSSAINHLPAFTQDQTLRHAAGRRRVGLPGRAGLQLQAQDGPGRQVRHEPQGELLIRPRHRPQVHRRTAAPRHRRHHRPGRHQRLHLEMAQVGRPHLLSGPRHPALAQVL